MYNQHLLKIERTVAAYQAILQEKSDARSIPWREKAPIYLLATCPFCLQPNTEKMDTHSLRGWWFNFAGGDIGRKVFRCDHFALTEAFVHFHNQEPAGLWGEYPAEVPHVIGYVLEEGLAQAVIHAVPICRIEQEQFIPAYTAFLVTYFARQNPKQVRERVIKFNIDYVEAGLAIEIINPPEGYEHWYDLAAYVARGELWWVDASDPALPIRTHDVAAFPYQDIHGRMHSHEFLPQAGPSYRYTGPRR